MIVCLGTTPTMQRTMTFAKLTLDSVNRAAQVHEYASGKSTNAARVLHTLGQPVIATGFLGGHNGRLFRADLDQAGIQHDFVSVEASTRLCITVIDESSRTATELIEESRPLNTDDYDLLLNELVVLLRNAKVLILSGTLPAGADPDFYARCVALAEPKVRVVLDAVGEPLLKALANRPLIVKPNQSEVGRTLGCAVDSEDALRDGMRQLASRGAQWAVVTRGRDETLVTNGQSFWKIKTPDVKVISAIGSGDAFAAGLAAGLERGDDVPQAALFGAACGSANAMTSYSGHVSAEDVRTLLGRTSAAMMA